MEKFIREEVKSDFCTPYILLDAQAGIYEISGESYLEDSESFYKPVLEWLDKFKDTHRAPVILNIKFTYFNSSSSKSIYKVLKQFKTYHEHNAEVLVNWYYPRDNQDIMMEGEDFRDALEIPFKFIPVQMQY